MATCGTWSGWRQRPKRAPQRQFILHHQRQVTQVSQATLQAGSNYGLSLTRRSAMGRFRPVLTIGAFFQLTSCHPSATVAFANSGHCYKITPFSHLIFMKLIDAIFLSV
jgi:hypothetical protein